MEEGFDTKTMTRAQLEEALAELGLETSGTKEQLRDRLETALIAQGWAPSPKKKEPQEKKKKRLEIDWEAEVDSPGKDLFVTSGTKTDDSWALPPKKSLFQVRYTSARKGNH